VNFEAIFLFFIVMKLHIFSQSKYSNDSQTIFSKINWLKRTVEQIVLVISYEYNDFEVPYIYTKLTNNQKKKKNNNSSCIQSAPFYTLK
jgi:hypothetical protein